MLKVYHYEDKTYELALEKCTKELNRTEKDLFIQVHETEAKLFKSKKVELEVIAKDHVYQEIKKFIQELGEKMHLEMQCEIKEEEGIYSVLLVSENNAILIGKEGKNLHALQVLLKQMINNNHNFNIKVNVDVANYKRKKVRSFETEIRKLVKDILTTHLETKLDPMNSYERRIVHTIVSEYEALETESVGEEPNRYVVIRYKED